MRRAALYGFLIAVGLVLGSVAVSKGTVVCTPLGSLTTNLSMCKPATGETNWDSAINNNFDILDNLFSALAGGPPGNGRLLIGNGTGFTVALPTGTGGITITGGSGTLAIGCSGCGGGGSSSLATGAVGFGSATGVLSGDATKFYWNGESLIVGEAGAETGVNAGLTAAAVAYGSQPGLFIQNSSTITQLWMETINNSNVVTFMNHGGSFAVPTTTNVLQDLVYFEGAGYDATNTAVQAARFEIDAEKVDTLGVKGRFRFYTTGDDGFVHEAGRINSDQVYSIASSVEVGSLQSLSLKGGQIGLAKAATSTTAPGASGAKLAVLCGTNPGTMKIVAYAGTSTTATTVLDNIGAGVTGC